MYFIVSGFLGFLFIVVVVALVLICLYSVVKVLYRLCVKRMFISIRRSVL